MRFDKIAKGVVFALVVVLLCLAPYAIRHAVASSAHQTAGSRPAAPASNAPNNSEEPPILFVKNPEKAPAFQLRDLTGKMISTADWNGKVVILTFWATWCPPCREEIPELIALQAKYKDQVQVVGISEDDDPPEKVLRFAQQKGINYPIVMVTADLAQRFGGVPALPTTFMIDTQGRVVQKHTGLYALEVYEREVRALLGLPGTARVETFVDNGQIFLKNAVNATELPGVKLASLTPEQKKLALHRLNAEPCTCGCNLTMAQCRINDTTCPISLDLAARVVREVAQGRKLPAAPPATAQN